MEIRLQRLTYRAALFPFDFQSSATLPVAMVVALGLIEQVDVLHASTPSNETFNAQLLNKSSRCSPLSIPLNDCMLLLTDSHLI